MTIASDGQRLIGCLLSPPELEGGRACFLVLGLIHHPSTSRHGSAPTTVRHGGGHCSLSAEHRCGE
jgi:hypothetical protein